MYGQEPGYGGFDWKKEKPQDLKHYSRMEGWHINEGDPDIRGWGVFDEEDNQIGKVKDLLVSEKANEVIFATVAHGGIFGAGSKTTLVPLDMIHLDKANKRANFEGMADRLDNAPEYTEDTRNFNQFYDYWTGRGAISEARMTEKRVTEERERRIPEIEEHLEVEKHPEQVGEVRIHKEVETHPETVRETVRRTRVRVIRTPVEPGREIKPGERLLREGETIEIPIIEEKLEATKHGEVTGEVIITPETVEEEEVVTGDVRKERVEIEHRGGGEVEEESEEERRRRRAGM
jgi:uncharacterized protein (TIGR02271 family)